jgi:hypothetical protein
VTGATGAKGSTGATGATGPVTATRTGAWSLVKETNEPTELVMSEISFTIPISESLNGSHVHFLSSGTTEGCPGSAANPKADPGHLCVYMGTAPFGFGAGTPTLNFIGNPATGAAGASKDGALIGVNGNAGLYNGTWAVTDGPPAPPAP